jgi:hypothetical protein
MLLTRVREIKKVRKKHWFNVAVIILLLSSSANTFAHVMRSSFEPSEIVQEADIICTATVLSTQCQWKDDYRGRHIYTHVELLIDRMIKGDLRTNPVRRHHRQDADH